jgi:PknH-like extracellular domain
MKRQILASGAAGLFALAVSGCASGHTAAPSSTAPPPPPPPPFEVAKADTLLLNADEMNAIMGVKLDYQDKPAPGWSQPPDPNVIDQGNAGCEPLFGPSTASVGTVYTAYRQNSSYESKDAYDHIVTQEVVIVADAGAAKQLLSDAVTKPLSSCDGQKVHIKDGKFQRLIKKTAVSDSDVRFVVSSLNMDPPNAPTGFNCADEVRAKNNVVIYTFVCQNGNGAPLTTAIVDKISGKVPGGATNSPS